AVFKTNRRAETSGQVDDFLHASAAEALRDEHSLQGALRAQSFNDGVKSNENGQARLSNSRTAQRRFVLYVRVEAIVETVREISQRDHQRQFHDLLVIEVFLQMLARIEIFGAGAGHFARIVQRGLLGEGKVLVGFRFQIFDGSFRKTGLPAAL